MKKLLYIAVLVFIFTSSKKEDVSKLQQETTPTEVVETWQIYREENLESVIDQWTGTKWTFINKWFWNIREDSEIILKLRADNTFIDRYADVGTTNGTWVTIGKCKFLFRLYSRRQYY